MFPSSSSRNPSPYADQTMVGRSSFTNYANPNSSFLHFPAPFLDDDELLVSHLLSQQQLSISGNTALPENEVNMAVSNKASNINHEMTANAAAEQAPLQVLPKKKSNGAKKPIPRKRTGKKDRHSKICTAKGPRDRRMRLSLQIARKFFDLQDMLGFDKASKTIEWLFTKSKAAIKELTGNLPQVKQSFGGGGDGKSGSHASDSGMVLGIKETACSHDGDHHKGGVANGESLVGIPKEKSNRKSRKAAYDPLARESREKARARARERTKEKMIIRSLEKSQQCSEVNPNNLEGLGSSRPFEESGTRSQEMNSSQLEVVADQAEEPSTDFLEHQMATVGIIEKFLGITSSSKSSAVFNHQHSIAVSRGLNASSDFPGFPGDWEISKSRNHCSYGAVTSMNSLTGNNQEQNPTSIIMAASNNIRLQSQLLENLHSCSPLDTRKIHNLY